MKKEQIVEHILEWNKKKEKMPLEAELRLTFKCNLHCFHCPNRVNEPARYMKDLPGKTWIRVVKECAGMGVKKCLLFGGGEAFTRLPLTLQLASLIKGFGMQGDTQTNGTLLTKKVAKRLVDIGWDRIHISLDGPTAEIHDRIRGKGVFNQIIKNINTINTLKKKNKKTKPVIFFATVMNSLIYNKLNKMVSLAYKMGVESVLFHPLDVHTNFGEKLKLSEKQINSLKNYVQEAKESSKKLNIYTNIEKYLDEGWTKNSWQKRDQVRKNKGKNFDSLPCYLPFYFISIMEEGYVEPCHGLRNQRENVLKKSLKDIWFGQYFQQIRENLIQGKLSKWCSECCAMEAVKHETLQNMIKERLK